MKQIGIDMLYGGTFNNVRLPFITVRCHGEQSAGEIIREFPAIFSIYSVIHSMYNNVP